MRILFTGASSFTGAWFARCLAKAGHQVVATFQRPAGAYDGVRADRVGQVAAVARPVHECSFGDERFMHLVREGGWDALCHHAADVRDYRSPDFDVAAALASNTANIREVLAILAGDDCRRLLLTGSFFEPNEGAGSDGCPAFSAYGLSKGLTAQVVRFHAVEVGIHLGKFVIPNPFGPFEEPRFPAYLVRTWASGNTPTVNTPAYVRDNVHVDLLAHEYAEFVASRPMDAGFSRISPSGYIETQGAFAQRFAREMEPRLEIACPVELADQTEFAEPRIRVNTDAIDADRHGWSEAAAWDAIGTFYRSRMEAMA